MMSGMARTLHIRTDDKSAFHWAELTVYMPNDGTALFTVAECNYPPQSCSIALDAAGVERLRQVLRVGEDAE